MATLGQKWILVRIGPVLVNTDINLKLKKVSLNRQTVRHKGLAHEAIYRTI
jgi:hypothetical protein